MLNKGFKDNHFQFGEGSISGVIACALAILSFLGVLAFHFPEYLTTPELRKNYSVEFIRGLMFFSLVLAGSLRLLNFIRNKNKRFGFITWAFILLAIALGGHQVEVQPYQDRKVSLGLDWFILDLLVVK